MASSQKLSGPHAPLIEQHTYLALSSDRFSSKEIRTHQACSGLGTRFTKGSANTTPFWRQEQTARRWLAL